jgi:hypothetical protein
MTAMSWPLRLRAMSFVITFAVVAAEVATFALPLAAIAWLLGLAGILAATACAIGIAIAYGLAIAIYTHLSPLGIRRRAA